MPPGFFTRFRARLSAAPLPQADVAKPTEEELQQDQEAVQKAISEAVTAALKNDDFTKAVAVHLATQLQPTLKSALDISTVEENLSKRLDEIQTATTARLSDLSNDLNNFKYTDKIYTLEEAVAQINVLLAALGKDVTAVQEQIAQQDTTVLSAHTAKLDSLATNLRTLQEQGPAPVALALSKLSTKSDDLAKELKTIQEHIATPDTSLVSSHTTKLDAIAAEIVAVKENNDTTTNLRNITSELASLKKDIESGAASSSSGLSGLTTQINSIQSALDTQNSTLAEIKAADASSDILAGIKSSNEFHSSHTTALSTIASKDNSTDIADLKSQVGALSSTVSEIKSANISPEILAAVNASNESHAAHASTLADIKTAVSTPAPAAEKLDLSSIETDVKSIITSIESQSATLSEIKTVAGSPAHVAEKVDLTTIETDVKTILATIESQQAALSEIKTVASTPAPTAEKTDISRLEADVKTLITNLDSHTSALSDIKTSSSGPEILAAIEALKTDVTASKANVTETSEQVKVIVNALPKLENEAVLVEVKAVKTAVEGIQLPKIDNSEVISELKAMHTVVSQTKDADILAEVKEIKVIVEKNAAVAKVEEVGENDKGVEVKKVENGNIGETEEKVEA